MSIDILDLIKFIITALSVVLGWVVGHYFTSKRDLANKRRDLTIQHLISAYRVLTNDVAHRPQTKENELKLELILSEIQLFGSKEQVKMAKKLANEVANKKVFELDSLINNLRTDLRKQLSLDSIDGNVTWLRFE